MPVLFEYIMSGLDFLFFLLKDVNSGFFYLVTNKTLNFFLILFVFFCFLPVDCL